MLERLSVLRDPARLFADYAVTQPSYIIFKSANYILAKNGLTGQIEFSGVNASSVIQSAINTLPNFPLGGCIYLKAGRYFITETIKLKRRVALTGEGFATILHLADGANVNLLELEDVSGCYLANFSIDGNKANNTSGKGIYINNPTLAPSQHRLEHIYIENTFEEGLHIYGMARDNTLKHVKVRAANRNGVVINTTDNVLVGCEAGTNDYWGFNVPASSNTFLGCWAWDNGKAGVSPNLDGFRLAGDENMVFGCKSDHNFRHGFTVIGERNILSGNIALNNGQQISGSGFLLYDALNNLLKGNQAYDNQTPKTQDYGVQEGGASDYNLILRNNLRGNEINAFYKVGVNTVAVNNIT